MCLIEQFKLVIWELFPNITGLYLTCDGSPKVQGSIGGKVNGGSWWRHMVILIS
jgi:hypothetical protein